MASGSDHEVAGGIDGVAFRGGPCVSIDGFEVTDGSGLRVGARELIESGSGAGGARGRRKARRQRGAIRSRMGRRLGAGASVCGMPGGFGARCTRRQRRVVSRVWRWGNVELARDGQNVRGAVWVGEMEKMAG